MPYLSIQSNQSLAKERKQTVMAKVSQTVAEILGKPEGYVMIALTPQTDMLFAASDEPTAYLELKSIGLPENDTAQLSQAICQLISQEMGIAEERIYIEFSNAKRNLWGWNGRTF